MKSKIPSSFRKSYWIETLGCPKNQVDSRRMTSGLLKAGFLPSASPQEADFILINSCAFIKEAQEETIDAIYESLKIKERNHNHVILVGCFAERFSEAVKKEIPELDKVVGVGHYDQIASIISNDFGVSHQASLNEGLFDQPCVHRAYAYFRIAQGCSRSCAFCSIPQIRGGLKKYGRHELEKQFEEEMWLRGGGGVPLSEVILVSQDTISQGISELEEAIDFFSQKKEVRWIRLHYLFPDKRVLKLLELFKNYPKLVSYLDIPFQHVSEKVLKAMNRPPHVSLFKEILQKWREVRPMGEVRTSFILGFPGEGEGELEEIREFLRDEPVEKLSLFTYSHEEGTPAHQSLPDEIPHELKTERVNEIRRFHLKERSQKRNEQIGSIEEMLVERAHEDELVCRREQDSPKIDEVVFLPPGKELTRELKAGDFVQVRLDQAMEYDWMGSLVQTAHSPSPNSTT